MSASYLKNENDTINDTFKSRADKSIGKLVSSNLMGHLDQVEKNLQ